MLHTDVLTQDQIHQIIKRAEPDDLKKLATLLADPYYTFKPFADDVRNFSQQTQFVNDTNTNGMICVLGGSGSGKSECGAYKLARFLRTTPPPDDLAIFFVVSEDLDLTTALWTEKLRHYFQSQMIQAIDWHKRSSERPNQVVFAPHKNGKRWQLIFKAASQGKKSFAGYNNVAGVWIDEPISMEIVRELWHRCRKYEFSGTKFWTLTPLDPYPDLEEIFHDQPSHPDWTFYRFNTRANTTLKNLSALEDTPDDMRATREIGAFCNMAGAVFKEWTPEHIIKHRDLPDLSKFQHYRVVDFGYEHETACLWIAHDRIANRDYVYHEWSESKLLISEKVDAITRQVVWASDDKHTTLADPADAQQRAEFANLGLPTSGAKKEPVLMSIESTRKRMMMNADGKPRLYVSDSCRKLIRQIKSYRWAPATKSINNPKSSPQKVVKYDDDLVDCLRMYCYTTDKSESRPWATINQHP